MVRTCKAVCSEDFTRAAQEMLQRVVADVKGWNAAKYKLAHVAGSELHGLPPHAYGAMFALKKQRHWISAILFGEWKACTNILVQGHFARGPERHSPLMFLVSARAFSPEIPARGVQVQVRVCRGTKNEGVAVKIGVDRLRHPFVQALRKRLANDTFAL